MPLDRGFDHIGPTHHQINPTDINPDLKLPGNTDPDSLRRVDLSYARIPAVGINGGSLAEAKQVCLSPRKLMEKEVAGFFLRDGTSTEVQIPLSDNISIIFNEQRGTISFDSGSPNPPEFDPRRLKASGFIFRLPDNIEH